MDYSMNGAEHIYNTRHREDLRIPKHRLVATQNNMHYWGIKLYNHLPQSLKQLQTIRFAGTIKRVLIEKEYYTMDEFFSDRLM